MTELLEEAIHRLCELPETMQNNVARAIIIQLEEELEPRDGETAMTDARSRLDNPERKAGPDHGLSAGHSFVMHT
jgi:hypothetical protein